MQIKLIWVRWFKKAYNHVQNHTQKHKFRQFVSLDYKGLLDYLRILYALLFQHGHKRLQVSPDHSPGNVTQPGGTH